MGTIVTELVDRLEAAHDAEEWAEALSSVIGMVFENVALFHSCCSAIATPWSNCTTRSAIRM